MSTKGSGFILSMGQEHSVKANYNPETRQIKKIRQQNIPLIESTPFFIILKIFTVLTCMQNSVLCFPTKINSLFSGK